MMKTDPLYQAASEKNYTSFEDQLKIIPIQDRIPVFCMQCNTEHNHCLFQEIYPYFSLDELLKIIELLPAFHPADEPLIDLGDTPDLNRQLNEQTFSEYLMLINVAHHRIDPTGNVDKEKTIRAALFQKIPFKSGLELPKGLFSSYLKQFDSKTLAEQLVSEIYFLPMLLVILNKQGPHGLIKFLGGFEKHEENALKKALLNPYKNIPTYKHLLEFPGKHRAHIIDIILTEIHDATTLCDVLEILLKTDFSHDNDCKRVIATIFPRLDRWDSEQMLTKYSEKMPVEMAIAILGSSSVEFLKNINKELYDDILQVRACGGKIDLSVKKEKASLPIYDPQILDTMNMTERQEALTKIMLKDTQLHLDDSKIAKLILRYYHTLPMTTVAQALSNLSAVDRYNTLMIRMKESPHYYFIEKIVMLSEDDLKPFLTIITAIKKSKSDFNIYSTPVKWAVKKVYSDNHVANSAVEAMSTVANAIPFIGKKATSAIKSFQTETPISEFLLTRMVRSNPSMIFILPALLEDLDSGQCVTLLRQPDRYGKSLLNYLLKSHNDKNTFMGVFVNLSYESKDEERLLNPCALNYMNMRLDLKDHPEGSARIGFIALLTVYNYICVRSKEPYHETYQESKIEFLNMLSFLQKKQENNTICNDLKNYCDQNPVREAWTVPTVIATVKLGSNRHKDARDKLLTLTKEELQGGLALFREFIAKRSKVAGSLDASIDEGFKTAVKNPSFTLV